MTEILFISLLLTGFGYVIGKLFIKLNPFLMLLGLFFIAGISPVFMELNNNYYTGCFVFGAVLNFTRPVTFIRSLLSNLFGAFRFRRANSGYSQNIEQQIRQAEDELYNQKRQVEEELKRQKHDAEQDIQRQRREAEEAIKREAENLRKERAKHQQSSSNQQNQNNGQSSSSNNKNHLNPRVFADACEILEMGLGNTLPEYKKAWKKLMSLYHSDKLAGLSDELRKQEEEKAKLVNAAWDTVKKKLK